MRYIPLNTLLEYRLVNHLWNTKALPLIQEKKQRRVVVKPKDFPRFCEDFDKAQVLPFLELGITLERLSGDLCSQFFAKHGTDIRDLEIREHEKSKRITIPEEASIYENTNKLQCILRQVPNLRRLSLELRYLAKCAPDKLVIDEPDVILGQVKYLYLESSHAVLGEGFLNGLFKMLPSVRILALGCFSANQDWDVFAGALKKLKIQSIRNSDALTEPAAFWNALAVKGSLLLKDLRIRLNINVNSNPDQHLLNVVNPQRKLLISQAECLEDLTLAYWFNENENGDDDRIPGNFSARSSRVNQIKFFRQRLLNLCFISKL